MKKRFIPIAALVLVLAAFAAPAQARAAPTALFVKDQTAEALFDNTDGCINTTVFIVASKSTSRSIPFSRSTTAGATINIQRIDTCTGALLMDARDDAGVLRAGQFEVNGLLNRAEMKATFQVTDFVTGSTSRLRVELQWRGVGPLSLQQNHQQFVEDNGCVTDSFLFGLSRAASASIEVSGVDRWLVRGRSAAADITLVTNGQVQRNCI